MSNQDGELSLLRRIKPAPSCPPATTSGPGELGGPEPCLLNNYLNLSEVWIADPSLAVDILYSEVVANNIEAGHPSLTNPQWVAVCALWGLFFWPIAKLLWVGVNRPSSPTWDLLFASLAGSLFTLGLATWGTQAFLWGLLMIASVLALILGRLCTVGSRKPSAWATFFLVEMRPAAIQMCPVVGFRLWRAYFRRRIAGVVWLAWLFGLRATPNVPRLPWAPEPGKGAANLVSDMEAFFRGRSATFSASFLLLSFGARVMVVLLLLCLF